MVVAMHNSYSIAFNYFIKLWRFLILMRHTTITHYSLLITHLFRKVIMKTKVDMTHGPIGKKTLTFALFLGVTGLMQQLFNAIDTVIMGQFVGKEAMAAVGSNAPIVGLMVTFFVGISLGSNVVIAQLTGKQDGKGVSRAVHTSVLFAFICGLIMAVIGECIAEPLLDLLQVPADIMDLALKYLKIIFLAMPGILMYNFTAAIFRSQGDTRTPLVCLLISGCIKVVISYVLVVHFGFDVGAVAISTMCATILSSLMLLVLLVHTKMAIRLQVSQLSLHLDLLKEILRIGSPAGLQSAVFCLSNIVIQAAINSLGTDVVAASAAAFNLEILAYIFVNAFGQTCTTFVGQNYGAGDFKRCRRVGVITTLQNLGVTIVICGVILYFGVPLLKLFNDDAAVVAYGLVRLEYILFAEPINLIIEMISGYLRGFGKSLGPALIVCGGICGSRLIYVFTVFTAHPIFDCLMAGYPISWVITAVCLIGLLLSTRKQLMSGH